MELPGFEPSRLAVSKADRFEPTDEQIDAGEKFQTRESLKINAYAGTGKTSTLKYISTLCPSLSGVYICFNKATAEDASKKFPPNVRCLTTHALAYRWVGNRYKWNAKKLCDTMNANAVRDILGLKETNVQWDKIVSGTYRDPSNPEVEIRGDRLVLQLAKFSARSIGSIVLQTLRRFQQTADDEIYASHVPTIAKLDGVPFNVVSSFRDEIVKLAAALWRMCVDPSWSVPLGHDGYLKLWSLHQPDLGYDFILLDEAQDTNPCVLHVMKAQAPAQIVFVGDKYQQIYQWRGAIDAMSFDIFAHESRLTESFRFGERIALAANCILRLLGERVPIRGNPAKPGIVADATAGLPARAIICRSNAGVIEAIITNARRRPCVVGGIAETLRLIKAVRDLQQGRETESPEFIGFSSWAEVVEFVESEGDHGGELARIVKLFKRYSPDDLERIVRCVVKTEDEAGVVISTAHKSKGKEWVSVQLSDDFYRGIGVNPETHDPAELRLLYVAMTRAENTLILSDVPKATVWCGLRALAGDGRANVAEGSRALSINPPEMEEALRMSGPEDVSA